MTKEKRREYDKKYYEKNKDKIKKRWKEYCEKNKDKIKEYTKQYMKDYNEKNKERAKEYYKKNKEKRKEYNLKKYYNITAAQFNQMLINQNYSCDICNTPLLLKKDSYVDHDHETKKVRGLLCINCNFGISHVKENIVTIQKAINYINSNYDNGNYHLNLNKEDMLKKEELRMLQNNKCFICDELFKNSKDVCLDHSYTINKIRKVLCRQCNSSLGYFRENIIIMQGAIDYLNKHMIGLKEVVVV